MTSPMPVRCRGPRTAVKTALRTVEKSATQCHRHCLGLREDAITSSQDALIRACLASGPTPTAPLNCRSKASTDWW
jgi:hypothetical protein